MSLIISIFKNEILIKKIYRGVGVDDDVTVYKHLYRGSLSSVFLTFHNKMTRVFFMNHVNDQTNLILMRLYS